MMVSSETLRVVLGEPIGSAPKGMYAAIVAALLAVVAAALTKNTVILVSALSVFAVAGIAGSVLSRATIMVTFDELVTCSRGFGEPATRISLGQIRDARVLPGPALEVVTVDGVSRRFGPWQRLTSTSQAHIAKCQCIVSAIAERVAPATRLIGKS